MKLRAFLAVVGYFAFRVMGASLSCQVAHAQAECIDPTRGMTSIAASFCPYATASRTSSTPAT